MKSIGIDIGGTSIKMSLIDENSHIIDSWSIPTNLENNGQNILNEIIESIRNILKKREIKTLDISVIGIGVPGPVDSETGLVKVAVNLGWENVNVAKILQDELDIPTFVLNDANAAAMGEKTRVASGTENMVFITLGTGVGGGIIINDSLLIGRNFAAGEIGHIPINSEESRICGCGNKNCLETFASANGLIKTVKMYYAKENKILFEHYDSQMFFEDLKNNDSLTVEIFNDYIGKLTSGIAAIANTIDAEVVTIGGGLSNAGSILLESIREKTTEKLFPSIKNEIIIELAKLGNDAGMIGAVAYGLERLEKEG